jgi:hypothetical protein
VNRFGTFTRDESAEITGECRDDDFRVAGGPAVAVSPGPVPSAPPGVLSVLGALPGVLVTGLFRSAYGKNPRPRRTPDISRTDDAGGSAYLPYFFFNCFSRRH